MFNFDYIRKEDLKGHNHNWSEIPDHPYGTLIFGGSGLGKINALLNLINHEWDIVKIYLYAKGPYEVKYQFLIKKVESIGSKYLDKKLLLNIRIIWMIFIKIFKNTIQTKNKKLLLFLMIRLLIRIIMKNLIK